MEMKKPRLLISEARDLIRKAERIEAKARDDPRLFGFASINRSLAKNGLLDADGILAQMGKPVSARALGRAAMEQYRKAMEDYWKAAHASPKELETLEAELAREGLL